MLRQAADERNVARVCRRFGISRKAFYKWKRRFDELGEAGLADRARTPHRSPRATQRSAVLSYRELDRRAKHMNTLDELARVLRCRNCRKKVALVRVVTDFTRPRTNRH